MTSALEQIKSGGGVPAQVPVAVPAGTPAAEAEDVLLATWCMLGVLKRWTDTLGTDRWRPSLSLNTEGERALERADGMG
ncbi:hypothetical protein ACOMHN_004136 [Nucella lapillus]